MLDHGWDVNHHDGYGFSALARAIDDNQWGLFSLLLNYHPSEETLYKSLLTALQYDLGGNSQHNNCAILKLISLLNGVNPQKHPDIMKFAVRGLACQYIIPFLKVGYQLPTDTEDEVRDFFEFSPLMRDRYLKFFQKVGEWATSYEFTDKSPLYVENNKLMARPEYEYTLRPKFPRKLKKQIYRRNFKLKNLRYIAMHGRFKSP